MTRVTPRLDAKLTLALAAASLAAYADYEGKPLSLPDGWAFRARFSGWDNGPESGQEERFGILLQATDGSGTCILAFRGTASLDDIWDDGDLEKVPFRPITGPVHPPVFVEKGFYGIYNDIGGGMAASMRVQVVGLVKAAAPKQIFVTGHSLGGALAQLFALDLSYVLPSMSIVQVITFASPRVGDVAFRLGYNNRIPLGQSIRVYNQQDLVPDLPPEDLGYQVAGSGFPVWFERKTLPELFFLPRHALLNYQTVLEKALPLPSQTWAGTFADATAPGKLMVSQAPS